MKIAINICYGRFILSEKALFELNKIKGSNQFTYDNIDKIDRSDKDLINIIETMGEDRRIW